MTQNTMQKKREPMPLNGVDTPQLFGAINLLTEQRELNKFQFRATNRWQQGTHSRTTFLEFSGAGGEQSHIREYTYDADHPEVFTGRDRAPTPVEFLLHGLAGCLTAGIGNIAAARGITLYEVESRVEGDIDMQGLLGISNEVRNGYESIRVEFKIKGDASEEKLRQIVERSRDRSAVFDVLTNGVPVSITVNGEAARS
ncbi:MAG: OsmC family protein [Acidobacteriota bacterium]|jgi:uncharacterized OsmC-like protein